MLSTFSEQVAYLGFQHSADWSDRLVDSSDRSALYNPQQNTFGDAEFCKHNSHIYVGYKNTVKYQFCVGFGERSST